MGGCSSTPGSDLVDSDGFPLYCNRHPDVSDEMVALAGKTWSIIVDDKQQNCPVVGSEKFHTSNIVAFYDSFYRSLFDRDESVQPLFKHSLKKQGRALVQMITAAVQLLASKKTGSLVGALTKLAERHSSYGVMPHHYAPVGVSLLAAFEATLPEGEWTEDAKAAWLEIYSLICTVMIPVSVRTCERESGPPCAACGAPPTGATVAAAGGGGGKPTMAVPPAGTSSEDPIWKGAMQQPTEDDELNSGGSAAAPSEAPADTVTGVHVAASDTGAARGGGLEATAPSPSQAVTRVETSRPEGPVKVSFVEPKAGGGVQS